eukprot:gene12790-14018_t
MSTTIGTPLINDDKTNTRRASSSNVRKFPPPSTPTISESSLPPPVIQTVIYQQLPPRLKDGIPYISETLRIVLMRTNQDMNVDTALIRATLNGSILVITIWQDAQQVDQFHNIYKTLNQQLVLVKMLLRNRPVIVIINAGMTRGKECFQVSNTYEMGGSGFNFGLQAYSRWRVQDWNPVCPDYLPDQYQGIDLWEEHLELDPVGHHVHHYAYPPPRLYFLSLCFPCCLCPQICIARFGNFYPVRERDLTITASKADDNIKILEISNAKVDDTDFTVGGVLPLIVKEEPINPRKSVTSPTAYVPPPSPPATLYGASGSAIVPNPLNSAPRTSSSSSRARSSGQRSSGQRGSGAASAGGAFNPGDEVSEIQLA